MGAASLKKFFREEFLLIGEYLSQKLMKTGESLTKNEEYWLSIAGSLKQ